MEVEPALQVQGEHARLRILVATPFAPRVDASHGGRVTASLLARLAERHQIALVCLRASD